MPQKLDAIEPLSSPAPALWGSGANAADPDVPLPAFGLDRLGALLRGDAASSVVDAEYGVIGLQRQKSTRQRVLLALLLIKPVQISLTTPYFLFAAEKVDEETRYYALSFMIGGFWLLATTIASFNTICTVTHPDIITEHVGGATYRTTQGHLTRLIADRGLLPQSTVMKLQTIKKSFMIITTIFGCVTVVSNTSIILYYLSSDHYPTFQIASAMLTIPFYPIWACLMCTWLFSLWVAIQLTSAAMVARATQTSTLAKTVRRPPRARTIFGSMRFPVPAEAIQLQQALATEGITLHIVRARAGQDISDEVFEWIEHSNTFLVFGTQNYGEDTGNPASSYAEAKYAQHQGKRIILLRMIPWELDFDHLQARVMFGQNKLTLDWQLGAPMPALLCEQIVAALELGNQQPECQQSVGPYEDSSSDRVGAASAEMIDDIEWRAVVEAPTLQLANDVLPTLSAGWGSSVVWVVLGCQAQVVANLTIAYEMGFFSVVATALRYGNYGLVGAWVFPQLTYCIVPALLSFIVLYPCWDINAACKRLEASIQAYCVKDLRMHRLVFPLSTALRSQNRGQGLGLTGFNFVITVRLVCAAMLVLWSVGLFVIPSLVHDVQQLAAGISHHPACPNSWQLAGEKCLMLFGSGLDVVNAHPLPWVQAETACRGMGADTHLASLTTPVQQSVAAHLVQSASVSAEVWIGLNDMDAAGSYDWTDDEPLAYANWGVGQPMIAEQGRAVSMGKSTGWHWANNIPAGSLRPYICAKQAQVQIGVSAASGGEMIGCAGGRWVVGKPYKQLDFPLKPLPPTVVSGKLTQPCLFGPACILWKELYLSVLGLWYIQPRHLHHDFAEKTQDVGPHMHRFCNDGPCLVPRAECLASVHSISTMASLH